MAKKPRRIREQNVFVKRKLTKEVRTLTIAKVPPRDHRENQEACYNQTQRYKNRVRPQL